MKLFIVLLATSLGITSYAEDPIDKQLRSAIEEGPGIDSPGPGHPSNVVQTEVRSYEPGAREVSKKDQENSKETQGNDSSVEIQAKVSKDANQGKTKETSDQKPAREVEENAEN